MKNLLKVTVLALIILGCASNQIDRDQSKKHLEGKKINPQNNDVLFFFYVYLFCVQINTDLAKFRVKVFYP